MSTHVQHPPPSEREEFLVDGCGRCKEYLDDLGLHFDAARWRAFWGKMVEVEFDGQGSFASELDKELGRQLYYVALGLLRATGIHPRLLVRPEIFVLATKPNLAALADHASNARTAIDEPEALPEGAVPAAFYEGLALGSDEGFRLFAIEQLDAVINGLRALYSPGE